MKNKKAIFVSVLAVFLLLFSATSASAKVMWGENGTKKGQIGKITVVKSINLWERDVNNKLKVSRVLNPGEEYRVYRYDNLYGGQYGLGGGMWVTKMPNHIKYETPSKAKLALLEKETTKVTPKYSSIDQLLEAMRDFENDPFWLKSKEGYTFGSFVDGTLHQASIQYDGWNNDFITLDIEPTSNNTATFSYYYLNADNYKLYNDGALKLVNNELHISSYNAYSGKNMTVKIPVGGKIPFPKM